MLKEKALFSGHFRSANIPNLAASSYQLFRICPPSLARFQPTIRLFSLPPTLAPSSTPLPVLNLKFQFTNTELLITNTVFCCLFFSLSRVALPRDLVRLSRGAVPQELGLQCTFAGLW